MAAAVAAIAATAAWAADSTWSGASSPLAANWSNAANWVGRALPSGAVGTITFPAAACTATNNCVTFDDVPGLSVSTLDFVDPVGTTAAPPPHQWTIFGTTPLTLTAGLSQTLQATGTGVMTSPVDISTPLVLGGPNTWTLGPQTETDLQGSVSGASDALALNVSGAAQTTVAGDVEVGPVTATGANPADTGGKAFANGALLAIDGGSLNTSDGDPLTVTDMGFVGSGATTGPLQAVGAGLLVGFSQVPTGSLAVNGTLTLDSRSLSEFVVVDGSGTTAGTDYGQVTVSGSVTLAGRLSVSLGTFDTCPTLTVGSSYTLITTTGTISGTFAHVASGATVTASGYSATGAGCSSHSALRIDYTANTVTATVVTRPKKPVQPPAPVPVLGSTAAVTTLSGTVTIKEPGSSSFVPLTATTAIPFGSTLDTTAGKVQVTTATTVPGATQSAAFHGGRFRLAQASSDATALTLNGPLRCGATRASANPPPRRKRVLWGNGHGTFTTIGSYASGTVLGTRWRTEDTCVGTRITVLEGEVRVTNRVTHHTLTVHAPHSYFAKR